MNKFIYDLLYENSQLSLTRLLAVFSYLLFAVGTAFLLIKNIYWQHYETFASLTCGGGLATQVVNKINNSLNNSNKGEFPQK